MQSPEWYHIFRPGYPTTVDDFVIDVTAITEYLSSLKASDEEFCRRDVERVREEFVPLCYWLGYPLDGSIIRDLCFHLLSPEEARALKNALYCVFPGADRAITQMGREVGHALNDKALNDKGIDIEPREPLPSRVKTPCSMYLNGIRVKEGETSIPVDSVKDLFGLQVWVKHGEEMGDLDALLFAVEALLRLPDRWQLRDYRFSTQIYPRVMLQYRVDEMPTEIQLRLARHRRAFEGINYAEYKKYERPEHCRRQEGSTLRLREVFAAMKNDAEYHETLLQLYKGDKKWDELPEPADKKTELKHHDPINESHKLHFQVAEGTTSPIQTIYQVTRNDKRDCFEVMMRADSVKLISDGGECEFC